MKKADAWETVAAWYPIWLETDPSPNDRELIPFLHDLMGYGVLSYELWNALDHDTYWAGIKWNMNTPRHRVQFALRMAKEARSRRSKR